MSECEKVTRRALLARGAHLVGVAGVLSTAGVWAGSAKAGCVDMTADNANPTLRTALNFTEQSPNPEQMCKGCAFFINDDPTGKCGNCKIFSGPTNPNGHCDSWAPPKADAPK